VWSVARDRKVGKAVWILEHGGQASTRNGARAPGAPGAPRRPRQLGCLQHRPSQKHRAPARLELNTLETKAANIAINEIFSRPVRLRVTRHGSIRQWRPEVFPDGRAELESREMRLNPRATEDDVEDPASGQAGLHRPLWPGLASWPSHNLSHYGNRFLETVKQHWPGWTAGHRVSYSSPVVLPKYRILILPSQAVRRRAGPRLMSFRTMSPPAWPRSSDGRWPARRFQLRKRSW
jgi:hypothetical protein